MAVVNVGVEDRQGLLCLRREWRQQEGDAGDNATHEEPAAANQYSFGMVAEWQVPDGREKLPVLQDPPSSPHPSSLIPHPSSLISHPPSYLKWDHGNHEIRNLVPGGMDRV